MIRRVILKNFRCFGPRLEVPLSPFQVLIGPNDSGKSAFFDAFRFYQDCEADGALMAASARDSFKEVLWRGVAGDKSNRSYRSVCTVSLDDGVQGFETDASYRQFRDIGASAPKMQERLVVEVLCPSPTLIPRPSLTANSMGSNGLGLSGALAWLQIEHLEWFKEIEAVMRLVFPGMIAILPEYAGGSPGYAGRSTLAFQMAHECDPRPARFAPEALLIFLAYVSRRFLLPPVDILLIEHPENYFSVNHMQVLVEQLRALSVAGCGFGLRPPQVLLTTHSPYFLDHFSFDDLLCCYRPTPSEPAEIKRVPVDLEWRERLNEYMVGESVALLGEETLARGSNRACSV